MSLHAVILHVKVLKTIILAKLKPRQFSTNLTGSLLHNFNKLSFGTGFLHDDAFTKVHHSSGELNQHLVNRH